MNEWLIILSSIGLTNILKYASILNFIRKPLVEKSSFLKELFSCSMCLGFWSGMIVSLLVKSESFLLIPLASSCLSQLYDYLIDVLDQYYLSLKRKNSA